MSFELRSSFRVHKNGTFYKDNGHIRRTSFDVRLVTKIVSETISGTSHCIVEAFWKTSIRIEAEGINLRYNRYKESGFIRGECLAIVALTL